MPSGPFSARPNEGDDVVTTIPYPQSELLPLGGGRLDPVQLLVVGYLARYKGTTRRTYAGVINRWITWCQRYGVDPLDVQRVHIELWARQLEEMEGLRDSTVGNYLNAVCGLYRFAHLDGYLGANPAAYVRRPKLERVSRTQYLTRTELLTVIDLAEADGPDAFALCTLLGFNGLRVSEACGIRIEEIARERGYQTIFVRRKGGRTQTLPLAPRTAWAVEQAIAGRAAGILLRAPSGKDMDRSAAGRIVTKLCTRAGIKKNITPHSFRHSFVTLSLDAGASPRDVQNSAGHADGRMTAYYDRSRESLARNTTHLVSAFVEGSA
jgi:integrase/recombinase XerD